MLTPSPGIRELICVFAPASTAPTFQNILVLFVGAVMSPKDRNVTGMLRAAGFLAQKQFATYHRVFSQRKWCLLLMAFLLGSLVIAVIPPEKPVVCVVDDTTVRRWGKLIYGKACHRDPVRVVFASLCLKPSRTCRCLFGRLWVVG